MKRIISLILTVIMLASCFTFIAYANEDGYDAGWDFRTRSNGQEMPFSPPHDYVSVQNPPDFTWPIYDGCTSYDLVVCSDEALTNVVYEQKGIKANYFNFNYTFEAGKTYYWAVKCSQGKVTGYCDARKFRITPDAHEFTVPDIDTLLARIPKTHPRIYTTAEQLEEFRTRYQKYPYIAKARDTYLSSANGEIAKPLLVEEPRIPTEEEKAKDFQWSMRIRTEAMGILSRALNCAMAYMFTGEEVYARRSIDIMMECSKWDWQNGSTSYSSQDQVHRSVVLFFARAYDMVYDKMTANEKATILKHIQDRAGVMEYLLDSISKNPYDSHGWTAFGYLGESGIALYGEIPEAEKWLRAILLAHAAVLPPWGKQDGGWSQGTDYWQYSTTDNKTFLNALAISGVMNCYDKAYQQNEYLWNLYVYPKGSYGSFGDDSNIKTSESEYYSRSALLNNAYFTKNPVARWLAEDFDSKNGSLYNTMDRYNMVLSDEDEIEVPINQQLSHHFKDIGWVAMTDDLVSPERVQMTFKSSPFGSFNHSHPDQNAFVIQAYGRKLASKSGYYDYYHSPHDSGFTRKTGAHNTITYDVGLGQEDDNKMATGEITAYLTQTDFDLASGDATKAYLGGLDKFERHMIYIRPDIFVVVDDLDAGGNNKSQFEWWLHSDVDMETYEGSNGARIVNENATLDTTIVYPEKVTTYYNNMWALSDMVEYEPTQLKGNGNIHRRVWFETEPLEKTKMVVAMDVHKSDVPARYVDYKYYDNYVKMTFRNGTVVLVNLTDDYTKEINAGNISFKGVAAVYNDESVMLVSGTSLKRGSTELISSDVTSSVVVGRNEISLSSREKANITINTNNEYVTGCENIFIDNGYPLGEEWGITAQNNADNVVFTIEADDYALFVNGKKLEAEMNLTAKVNVKIDGLDAGSFDIAGYKARNDVNKYNGTISIPEGKYCINSVSEGVSFGGHLPGTVVTLKDVNVAAENTEVCEIELTKVNSVSVGNLATNGEEDADTLKDKLAVMVEAEHAVTLAPGSKAYTTRSWLSGGQGVQLHDNPGATAVFRFNVTEAGTYDIAVKYVAWLSDATKRCFYINGTDYIVTLPRTVDYGTAPENWKYVIADTGVYLEPGEYMVSVEAIGAGDMWNYDYLGLVKR